MCCKCVASVLLISGCKSTPVVPANQLSINYTPISQADAKKLYRQKLTEVMIATEKASSVMGISSDGELSRMLEDEDFRGG